MLCLRTSLNYSGLERYMQHSDWSSKSTMVLIDHGNFYLPGASLSLGITNGYHSHQQFVIVSKFMLQIEGHLCHVLFWIRVCSLINACSILIGQARVPWFWLVMEIFYLLAPRLIWVSLMDTTLTSNLSLFLSSCRKLKAICAMYLDLEYVVYKMCAAF